MAADREKLQSGIDMVLFTSMYTQVLAKQLREIQTTMETTVASIMDAIASLNKTTEGKKREAEAVLDKTYLSPDRETVQLVTSIQDAVDAVMEGRAQDDAASANLRRFGGKFSKHMESLSTLDDSIRNLIFNMVGSLSSDDVIRQRLDHIIMSLHALQFGLSNILVDYERRFTLQNIEIFREQLLEYTYRNYTMEEERMEFAKTFGEAARKLKKAS